MCRAATHEAREKELIKAVPEMDMINAMVGAGGHQPAFMLLTVYKLVLKHCWGPLASVQLL